MSNLANSNGGLQITSGGALYQWSFTGSYAMTANGAAVLNQDVGGASWVAVSIGSAATVAKFGLKVLTPAASGTKVSVSLTNTGSQIFCDVPVGEGILLVNPPAAIYVKSDSTGTDKIPIQTAIAER